MQRLKMATLSASFLLLVSCGSTVSPGSVRVAAPDAELTQPCVGPSQLTSPIRETALLRDRANHRICAERHEGLAGWAQAIAGAL